MHHVLIILTLIFIQGHTYVNHENDRCSILSETIQALPNKFAVQIVRRKVDIISSQPDHLVRHSRSQLRLKLNKCLTCTNQSRDERHHPPQVWGNSIPSADPRVVLPWEIFICQHLPNFPLPFLPTCLAYAMQRSVQIFTKLNPKNVSPSARLLAVISIPWKVFKVWRSNLAWLSVPLLWTRR